MVWISLLTIKNWKSVLLDFLFRHRPNTPLYIGGAFSVQKSMLCIWSDGSLITYKNLFAGTRKTTCII